MVEMGMVIEMRMETEMGMGMEMGIVKLMMVYFNLIGSNMFIEISLENGSRDLFGLWYRIAL